MTILALDCHYLCYRAFHAMKHLSWDGEPTGAIFGFFKAVSSLKQEFQPDKLAFCFDHACLKRRELYPDYKRKRKKLPQTEQEQKQREALAAQISDLHHKHLPKIGYQNVLCHSGYEGDDLMAAIAAYCPKDDDVILATADDDLWQCLRSNVMMYSPAKQKLFTEAWFRKTFKFAPRLWAQVKAMAGCHGDGVLGIPGIGERTAAKFIREELNVDGAAFLSIVSEAGRRITRRNQALVTLPFTGCPVPVLVEDERLSLAGWQDVCENLGMRSFANRLPI